MSDLDNRLKSITISTLEGFDTSDLDTLFEEALKAEQPRTVVGDQISPEVFTSLFTEYKKIIKSSEPRLEGLMLNLAWRCNRILHNGKVCNTLNGIVRNTRSGRKTCSKCQQKRLNEKTFFQELQDRNENNA